MRIRKLVVGELAANCYIVWDESTGKALVVDPGGDAEKILALVKREELDLEGIINTHAHIDHILANDALREITGVPLLIHPAEIPSLSDPELNLSRIAGRELIFHGPDRLIEGGEEIKMGQVRLKILHTPGHTPGSICLSGDGCLLSGDTIFAGSVGRCDFPGGNFEKLDDSLRKIISLIPGEVRVFPGHGPETTMETERRVNPFFPREMTE